jgi:hypothetical protein
METALPNEDVQAIINELASLMIRHGYQRRGGTWYLFNPELLRIFDFQPGTYRKKAYFNLGLMVRALDNSSRPRISECSAYGRLDRLVPDIEEFERATNFESGMTREEQVAFIVKTVLTVVLPFLAALNTVEDVRRFVCSPNSRGLQSENLRNMFYDAFNHRRQRTPRVGLVYFPRQWRGAAAACH